jgi:hypothetical protein
MDMRKISLLLGVLFIISSQLIYAQDIFKQHGFDKKPLTLSNGHYKEFFPNEEVVQIGTVLLNTKTKKVVAFLDEDTTNVMYLPEFSSRWVSPDPLAAKFPEWTPYVFVKNNPIVRIDLDGREDFLVKQIKDSKSTTAESVWLVYPTGTFAKSDLGSLREMSVADIKEQFGKPMFERMGSSLPDNPSTSDNDKSGNATIKEGSYTYEKGHLSNGLPAVLLDEGNGAGKVSTEFTNYSNNPEGEKMAIGVAGHAGKKDWQVEAASGKDTQKAKGSEGCPTTTGFGEIYKKVESKGNFIIVRDPKKDAGK